MVDQNISGQFQTGVSSSPSISSDGNLVVFISNKPNLVTGDTGSETDMFLRNLETGTIKRLNERSGVRRFGSSNTAFAPQISPDGKNVAFANYEDLTGHGKGGNQIYLLNLVTEEIKCISVSTAYNGGGFHNQISDNKVLFQNQSPIFDPLFLGKNVYYSQEYDIASGVLMGIPRSQIQ